MIDRKAAKKDLKEIAAEIEEHERQLVELRTLRSVIVQNSGGFVGAQDKARDAQRARFERMVALCWQRCCEHDGIDPAARNVAFSKDNPIVPYYQSVLREFQHLEMSNAALGYTGIDHMLKIGFSEKPPPEIKKPAQMSLF